MARKTVLVSDLTGEEINGNGAAQVKIITSKDVVVLDVNADEVADLAAKGRSQKRRGRRPKAAA